MHGLVDAKVPALDNLDLEFRAVIKDCSIAGGRRVEIGHVCFSDDTAGYSTSLTQVSADGGIRNPPGIFSASWSRSSDFELANIM